MQETSLVLPAHPQSRCPQPPCGHGGHLGGSRTGTEGYTCAESCGRNKPPVSSAHQLQHNLAEHCTLCSSWVSSPAPPSSGGLDRVT